MITSLHRKLQGIEELAAKAVERLKALEAENKRLKSEVDFLAGEQKKALVAVERFRSLSDGHERIRKRLEKLRDRLRKLEA